MALSAGKKRCLVTGGAGFLGTNLCLSLLRDGYAVTALDSLFTGTTANVKLCESSGGDNYKFVRHDVCNPYPDEVEKEDFDWLFNLACPASPPHYQADPVHTMLTSVMGAKHCLDYAERHGGCTVLQASTSEVYGDPDVSPQPEEYRGSVNCTGVRSCYDEGKRAAETLFFDYMRARGVKGVVVRIFNTYGPHMHPFDGRVVSNFILQALAGQSITLYGDGTQTRSFCFVTDLVRGLRSAMLCADEKGEKGPINLGNPDERTVKDLAEKVLALVHGSGDAARSKLEFKPLPKDDPRQRCPDIAKAKAKLGWTPTVGIDEGLAHTIAYFQQLDLSSFTAPTSFGAHTYSNMDDQMKGGKKEEKENR